MRMEIVKALAEAIRNHQEIVVSSAMAIVGTGVGAGLSGLVGWWRSRGRFEIVTSSMSAAYFTPRQLGEINLGRNSQHDTINEFSIELLVFSSFATPKAFTVEAAELVRGTGKRAVVNEYVDAHLKSVKINNVDGLEAVADAQSFIRLRLEGRAISDGVNSAETAKAWDRVRITLRIAPSRKIELWHIAKPEEQKDHLAANRVRGPVIAKP